MQEAVALVAIASALGIAVVSPGPSFVLVARVAVSSARANGLAVALGMGLGGASFALAALLGLQAVLLAVPTLYVGLKIAGGLYLCYLGVRIFLGARRPLPDGRSEAGQRVPLVSSLWLGLSTQLSNPKTAVVYASVFAALLPPTFSLAFAVALVAVVFAMESCWYAVVAVALSSAGPRRMYLSCKASVDRVAGSVMFALGLKLVTSSHGG